MCPEADILYACDQRWWEHHLEAVREGFSGSLWTQAEHGKPDAPEWAWAQREGLNIQPGLHGHGLGKTVMHYGGNSGYQAINFAYLLGAKRIILLGYDMMRTGGMAHFFGDHPGRLHTGTDYAQWAPGFKPLADDLKAEGVQVINCTRETALTCFKRATMDDLC